MKQRRILGMLTACVVLSSFVSISEIGSAAAAAEVELKTAIVSVSVYGKEAQVVRRGEVGLQPGRVRLVCRDVPSKLIESSLFVAGSGTARARIVGIDLVRQDISAKGSERYEELSKDLKRLTSERQDLLVEQEALGERRDFLGSIKEFSTDKAHAELSRQAFSIQEWKTLLDFYQVERGRAAKELNALGTKLDALDRKIAWTTSEIRFMDTGATTHRSIAIDCDVESAGTLTIDLSYIVPDASWTPEYAIRYDESAEQIDIAYNAEIRQATGEDWKGVSVLLSTAEPQFGAAPPPLLPLTVALYASGGGIAGRVTDDRTGDPLPFANIVIVGTKLGTLTLADGSYRIANVPAGRYEVKAMMMGYAASVWSGVLVSSGKTVNADFALKETKVGRTQEIVVEAAMPQVNVTASDVRQRVASDRLYETTAPAPPQEPAPLSFEEAGIASTEFAANLQIKTPVDLDSGAEPRRAVIVRERLGGTVLHHAVPSLSERVFLKGTFENSLAVPILPGLAEVYVETTPPGASNRVSTFVGREAMVGVAPGQTFTVHLGIDQGVKLSHELAKKEHLSRGARKASKIRYEYLIALESFKKEPVEVLIEDRIPTSGNAEIKIEDIEIKPVPSEQHENGLLAWKVPLPPGGKTSIRIGYTIVLSAGLSEREIMFKE